VNLQIHAITPRIYLGPFLTPERAAYLLAEGVTHALNVSDSPSIIKPSTDGFVDVSECPLVDLTAVPDAVAKRIVDLMHQTLRVPSEKIYVHCIAGQNRSPTAIWLFLIACGVQCAEAKRMIESKSFDAVPGHHALVDSRLIELVKEYGQELKLPRSLREFS
jgi:protein-tyrosine phosphatase